MVGRLRCRRQQRAGRPRATSRSLSPDIVGAVEQAIAQYSDIVARGGWPMVPAEQKLRIGARGPAVAALRQRLIISGDLDAYDRRLRRVRFLRRGGGEALPGAPRHSGRRRGRRLDLRRAERAGGGAPQPARDQPHPAQDADRTAAETGSSWSTSRRPQVEAVENGVGRVAPHRRSSARSTGRRRSSISKITEINFNPFWTVPASIIRKDLIPHDAEGSELPRPTTTSASTTSRATSSSRRRSTGTPTRRPTTCSGRIRATSTRWAT